MTVLSFDEETKGKLKKQVRRFLLGVLSEFDEQDVDIHQAGSFTSLDLGGGKQEYMVIGVRYSAPQEESGHVILVSSMDTEDSSGDAQILANHDMSEFTKL